MKKQFTHIKSVFEQIASHVFTITDIKTAKQFTIEFIESKQINDSDKKSIVTALNNINSITSYHKYICNALLKYEGLGTSQLFKETTIQWFFLLLIVGETIYYIYINKKLLYDHIINCSKYERHIR